MAHVCLINILLRDCEQLGGNAPEMRPLYPLLVQLRRQLPVVPDPSTLYQRAMAVLLGVPAAEEPYPSVSAEVGLLQPIAYQLMKWNPTRLLV